MFERLFGKAVGGTGIAGTSGTANFQESSANVGDTIHADFTWADAELSPYGNYAAMWIEDPYGNQYDYYSETVNPTGSHTSSYTADMVGTWYAGILVWNGVTFVSATDTINVTEPGGWSLSEALTCKWVDGYQNHGSQVTEFDIAEDVYAYAEIHGSDMYGKTVRHEWWYKEIGASNFTKKWEWEATCGGHYTEWASWTWWDIGNSYGTGEGYIKIYLDGVYLGKTNNYSVSGEGIAEIISVSAPDTFSSGVTFDVDVVAKNTGYYDVIFVRIIDVDTGNVLDYRALNVSRNATRTFPLEITLTQTTDFHGRVEAGHIV